MSYMTTRLWYNSNSNASRYKTQLNDNAANFVSVILKENSDMAEKDHRKRYTIENCCTMQDHSFANEKQKHCLK